MSENTALFERVRTAFQVPANFLSLFERSATDAHAPLDGIRALAVLWVEHYWIYYLNILI